MSGDETSTTEAALTPAQERAKLFDSLPAFEVLMPGETRRDVLDRWTSSAMAGQEFGIEEASYAAAYKELYAVYSEVRARREAAQQALTTFTATSVSPSVYGIDGFAARARTLGEATVNELIATENQYAKILAGMYATFRSTKAEDDSRAAGFTQIGTPPSSEQ